MILQTHFDARGVPLVDGIVYLPGLGNSGAVTFLMDTGADVTCLGDKEVVSMQIPRQELKTPAHISGIGGSATYYWENARVLFPFLDSMIGSGFAEYSVDIAIAGEGAEWSTSILGRDILNRWDIRYNYGDNILQCEVHSADAIL